MVRDGDHYGNTTLKDRWDTPMRVFMYFFLLGRRGRRELGGVNQHVIALGIQHASVIPASYADKRENVKAKGLGAAGRSGLYIFVYYY